MGGAPVHRNFGRVGRRGLPIDQRPLPGGPKGRGFIGLYVRGAHIDPWSNLFDYGLLVAILVIGLLIARTWHVHPVQSGAQGSMGSGIAGSSASVNPSAGSASGDVPGVPLADGAGDSQRDTVLAAGPGETGELANDRPPLSSLRRRIAPKLIHQEPAEYTKEARFAGFKGKITAVFTVDEEGTPQNIELTSPAPYGLAEKAIAAVRQWRYQPATRDGRPATARLVEEVPFR